MTAILPAYPLRGWIDSSTAWRNIQPMRVRFGQSGVLRSLAIPSARRGYFGHQRDDSIHPEAAPCMHVRATPRRTRTLAARASAPIRPCVKTGQIRQPIGLGWASPARAETRRS